MMKSDGDKKEKDKPQPPDATITLPIFTEMLKSTAFIGAISGNFTGFPKDNKIFYEEYNKHGRVIDQVLLYGKSFIKFYELVMYWGPSENPKSTKNEAKLIFVNEFPIFGEIKSLMTFKPSPDSHKKLILAIFKDYKVD